MKRNIDEIRENLIDVVGIGLFVVGICAILKEGITTLSLAWFVLGCAWICILIFRVFTKKSTYTVYVLFFTFFFLLGYSVGSFLGLYKFRPEGLLYWYVEGGVIIGSMMYFLQKREKQKLER